MYYQVSSGVEKVYLGEINVSETFRSHKSELIVGYIMLSTLSSRTHICTPALLHTLILIPSYVHHLYHDIQAHQSEAIHDVRKIAND